jgi:transposase
MAYAMVMSRKTQRSPLQVSPEEKQRLEKLAQSQTAAHREVRRARMMLYYMAGKEITQIASFVKTTRRIVYECIDRALAMGPDAALKDLPNRGAEPKILPEDKAWVLYLACTKPKELGYAAEIWSRKSLAEHIRKTAKDSGHDALARANKATVHRILTGADVQPHKIRYYLERRDPDFEAKMKQVLIVYREIATALAEGEVKTADGRTIYTVSVDEKPGVQALANTATDLPPVPGIHPTIARDHEYKRLGTASIIASLDLQDGQVIARVERRHRSQEFIGLLKDLDAHYPQEAQIRLILDNHSAHISKETMAYLATRPNRFCYVHTPKHGSWLNLVETLFGKMARTFLRGIRVSSWEELRERILKGIAEINLAPVVHKWKNFELLETHT